MINYVFTIFLFSLGFLSFAILIILPLKTPITKYHQLKKWDENGRKRSLELQTPPCGQQAQVVTDALTVPPVGPFKTRFPPQMSEGWSSPHLPTCSETWGRRGLPLSLCGRSPSCLLGAWRPFFYLFHGQIHKTVQARHFKKAGDKDEEDGRREGSRKLQPKGLRRRHTAFQVQSEPCLVWRLSTECVCRLCVQRLCM